MSKIAFVFPGQGSQSVGMGKDLADLPEARHVYDTFDHIVAAHLSQICFEGPEEELRRTLYTQPAILATSIAALELFRSRCDVKPHLLAGHSLGEYGALYAADVISLETAAQLVKRRSELMEAAPKGAMSAVLGLNGDQVDAIVNAYRHDSQAVIAVANYNTDSQIVISGAVAAVEQVSELLKSAGAKRVIPLPVGGAFHSPLMSPAAQSFTEYLSDFDFQNAQMPVVTNVDAALTTQGIDAQAKLSKQIDHSVCWTQTMTRMIREEGVDTVVEFGPGKVLTGMFKKMFPEVRLYNVLDVASLDATVVALQAAPVNV
ncbi:ACP S-malonyltransferase [Vampirovibrio sp.]|uniref:ACP S-malonyltransferase n=1 Tax=Vampirovibrio sp. TaxID=2717857 RepID=UPI003592F600